LYWKGTLSQSAFGLQCEEIEPIWHDFNAEWTEMLKPLEWVPDNGCWLLRHCG
jgi:hypothetical protein